MKFLKCGLWISKINKKIIYFLIHLDKADISPLLVFTIFYKLHLYLVILSKKKSLNKVLRLTVLQRRLFTVIVMSMSHPLNKVQFIFGECLMAKFLRCGRSFCVSPKSSTPLTIRRVIFSMFAMRVCFVNLSQTTTFPHKSLEHCNLKRKQTLIIQVTTSSILLVFSLRCLVKLVSFRFK